MGLVIGAALLVVFVLLAIISIASSVLVICPPNRVAIITGRKRTLSDGRTVGYRIIKGGRAYKMPIFEQVAWMDLNTIPLEVSVTNAYSRGTIPLNVQGIANVKISSKEGVLENAAERFLNVPNAQIGQIAKETLEANLRGVLATLSPEEVNEDRLLFSQKLIDEADDDIRTLGLDLDVMKIQNVTDDNLYLESVGRRLTAEVVKEARVAEANRQSESEQAEANARQLAEIASRSRTCCGSAPPSSTRSPGPRKRRRRWPATSPGRRPSRTSSSSASSWSAGASRPTWSPRPEPTSRRSS